MSLGKVQRKASSRICTGWSTAAVDLIKINGQDVNGWVCQHTS